MSTKSIGAQAVHIQCFTKRGADASMVKHCRLDDDGNLVKDSSHCQMSSGTVETLEATPSSLPTLLDTCKRNQAYCFSNIALTTVCSIASRASASEDDLTRTLDNFGWVDGPTALLFDIDGFSGSTEEAVDIINSFIPGFKDAAKIAAPSTSSGIYNTDTNKVLTNTSIHIVVFVEDAAELPDPKALRERVLARAWLAGHGHIFTSKAGAMTPRCIVDVAAFSPERLIFRGPPDLDPPLSRKQEKARYIDGCWLDISGVIEPLTADEEHQFRKLVTDEKAENQSEANCIRASYIEGNVLQLVCNGVNERQALRIVQSRLSGTVVGNDLLYFDEIDKPVSVAEVLQNPRSFHELTLADPVEPDYGGSPGIPTRNKAILYAYTNTGAVTVFSHAHGGQTFHLKHNRDSAKQALELLRENGADNDEMVDEWRAMRSNIEADQADLDQIFRWFKSEKIASIGALRDLEAEKQKSDENGSVDDAGRHVAEKVLCERYSSGKNLLHTPDNSFWGYTGTHWERVTDDSVKQQILPYSEQLSEETRGKFRTSASMNEAFNIISAKQACNKGMLNLEELNPNPVINLKNGELWLTDDGPELRPHSRDTLSLYVGPVEYHPEALCPTYDEFMNLVFAGDECAELIRHLEEILGYCIQPERFMKLNGLWYGDGYNAKTPIAEIPQRILGTDIVSEIHIEKLEQERFTTSSLVGKLVAIDDDMKYGSIWPDSQMKKLSERKLIRGEFKGKDQFNFMNRAVPIVLSNSIPYFKDTTPAIKKRLDVIHFPHSFKDSNTCDRNDPYSQDNARWLLTEVFSNELSGVLNRLIDGYYRLKKRGHLDPPKACLIGKENALKEGNTLLWFLDEEYIHDNTADSITLNRFHRDYESWCMGNGVRFDSRLTTRTLSKRLRDAGITVKVSHGDSKVFGLRRKKPESNFFDRFGSSTKPQNETLLKQQPKRKTKAKAPVKRKSRTNTTITNNRKKKAVTRKAK